MTISASSNALAKLEPFRLLAQNARGAAAARLISEVTAAPGCYVFSELFECQGIKEVS
jgi:COP9 signalosome complex subunit 7